MKKVNYSFGRFNPLAEKVDDKRFEKRTFKNACFPLSAEHLTSNIILYFILLRLYKRYTFYRTDKRGKEAIQKCV